MAEDPLTPDESDYTGPLQRRLPRAVRDQHLARLRAEVRRAQRPRWRTPLLVAAAIALLAGSLGLAWFAARQPEQREPLASVRCIDDSRNPSVEVPTPLDTEAVIARCRAALADGEWINFSGTKPAVCEAGENRFVVDFTGRICLQ
jgi:hypothetical protein